MEMLSILFREDGKGKVYSMGRGRLHRDLRAKTTPFHRVCSMTSKMCSSVKDYVRSRRLHTGISSNRHTRRETTNNHAQESRIEHFFLKYLLRLTIRTKRDYIMHF